VRLNNYARSMYETPMIKAGNESKEEMKLDITRGIEQSQLIDSASGGEAVNGSRKAGDKSDTYFVRRRFDVSELVIQEICQCHLGQNVCEIPVGLASHEVGVRVLKSDMS